MKLCCSNFTISGINNNMEDQVSRLFYLFGTHSLPWITTALVAFVAVAVVFHCLGFLSIFLTSSALILCPIVFTLSSKPNSSTSNPGNQVAHRDEALRSGTRSMEQSSSKMEEEFEGSESTAGHQSREKMRDEVGADHEEAIKEAAEVNIFEEEEEEGGHVPDSLTMTTAKSAQISNTEDDDDDNSHLGWSSRDSSISTYNQAGWWSDGSISDEESLIEIELPTGHYVEFKNIQDIINKEYNNYIQQKWQPDCPMESLFRQQSLMELLSDQMNEEDNLIEIDISMGSIKCPRCEIKKHDVI